MDGLAHFPSTLGPFATGLSQHARLITLATAQGSALPESLMAKQFSVHEAVNELFPFDVDALSASTNLDLGLLIGEEITLNLLQADDSYRAWHGICTDAGWLGADGGVAGYRLRLELELALALLCLRHDSYIFQDKNAQEIVAERLADYPQVRFEFDVTQTMAPRAICTQYRESDLDFLIRVLASEGPNWRVKHIQTGEAEDDAPSTSQARHRLVIFDSKAVAPAMPGEPELRFHGVHATEKLDSIDTFAALRQVHSNELALSSWDPAQLVAPAAVQASSLDAGELPWLPLHDGSGERRHANGGAADLHSSLVLQALELDNKSFAAAGAVCQLAAGHAFRLTQHEHYAPGADRFTVLWVNHTARKNFEPGLEPAMDGAQEAGTYRCSVGCVRESVPIVPRASTALGPQTALVVGLPDPVTTTIRNHQVKIQFGWQRGNRANAGGLGQNTDQEGNAPGDEASGAWVWVCGRGACRPQLGLAIYAAHRHRRAGRFHGRRHRPSRYRRPAIYGRRHSALFDTRRFRSQSCGVLSGIHSHNFEDGFNQWQLDDTPDQLRTRLASSTATTQLNSGHLIQQSPTSAQRGSYRGSGFELRTDDWGMPARRRRHVDFDHGMGSARQRHPVDRADTAEAIACLKGAKELSKAIATAAAQQNAFVSKDANAAPEDFIAQIDQKEKGKYDGAVNGQSALKEKEAARTGMLQSRSKNSLRQSRKMPQS